MVIKTIPAVKARVHWGEIMKKVFQKGERFIVEKSGIPMVAILKADEYFRMVGEQEERFKVLDQIKSRLPQVSPQEIEEDIKGAIKAVRQKHG